eukprot:GDKH01018522.1.p3 GENE.GDKH01018522.1~~GDKH01018522.1.p3  ORF type:complete len:52 (+),score=4.98 GDKH01018522.1:78-233(+)
MASGIAPQVRTPTDTSMCKGSILQSQQLSVLREQLGPPFIGMQQISALPPD